MLYVLLEKLPIDLILYIKKKFLNNKKKCKNFYKILYFNSIIYKEINKWSYCSKECYEFI